MKPLRSFLLFTLFVFCFSCGIAMADDLDDLMDLSDDMSSLDEMADETGEEASVERSDGNFSITYGGYVKALAYWSQEKYSTQLWGQFQTLKAGGGEAPNSQDLNGISNLGIRSQVNLEGYWGDHVHFYTALNLNYNFANSLHSETLSSTTNQRASAQFVEGYVELYEHRRVWKVGSQIVTWSFIEGIEVPTDRVNARDQAYKSSEYEDSKLASTGILMTQNIGDMSRLEMMWMPEANVNTSMEFLDYLFTGPDADLSKARSRGKVAARFVSNVGNLDYAISYVDGLDPAADLKLTQLAPTIYVYGKSYNKVKSPGIDLQYNFGGWLAKLSWANFMTEDTTGLNPLIKNSWSKTVAGVELTVFEKTLNFYVGQTAVENYQSSEQTSFLLGQIAEKLNFVSGHINASFLTGDALNLMVMAANYWNGSNEAVQTILKSTVTYKIGNGMELAFSPSYMEIMKNRFNDLQLEFKYAF